MEMMEDQPQMPEDHPPATGHEDAEEDQRAFEDQAPLDDQAADPWDIDIDPFPDDVGAVIQPDESPAADDRNEGSQPPAREEQPRPAGTSSRFKRGPRPVTVDSMEFEQALFRDKGTAKKPEDLLYPEFRKEVDPKALADCFKEWLDDAREYDESGRTPNNTALNERAMELIGLHLHEIDEALDPGGLMHKSMMVGVYAPYAEARDRLLQTTQQGIPDLTTFRGAMVKVMASANRLIHAVAYPDCYAAWKDDVDAAARQADEEARTAEAIQEPARPAVAKAKKEPAPAREPEPDLFGQEDTTPQKKRARL